MTKPRATAVSVDPTGLTNVTATDVQGAIEDLDAASGGGGGSLTVQDENSNVATSVTQIDFQGAGVSVANGTGEVVVTVPGGSSTGSSSPWYLARKTLDSTYGDDFSGTSLNGRWTRHTVTSGQETWQAGESGLYVNGLGSGHLYLQTAPAGDFTVEVDLTLWAQSTTFICGPVILDSSGAGIGCGAGGHSGTQFDHVNMASYAYSFYNTGVAYPYLLRGQRVWVKLTKTGTSFQGAWSLNGQVYFAGSMPASLTSSFTAAYIGVGCIFGDSANNEALISRFNVV